MTIDHFTDYLKHTVARERGVPYDPEDTSLLRRITVQEAAKVLQRSIPRVYHYVSDGYMKRDNERRAYFAEFSASEVVRCAELIGIIRDPQIPKPTAPIRTHRHRRHAVEIREFRKSA